ncbi:MAG TPA: hypothetical protein VMU95_41200 [Trebonia sp.]|nr:hypothetical protein [Trebonia sp.]
MPKLDAATAKAVAKAEGSGSALLDEDEYVLKLDKVVVSPKPDVNGNGYWIWTFSVVSGQLTGDKFKGKTIRANTGFAENQAWFLKMFFEAFEVKPNVDTDILLGKEVKGIVGQREIQKGARKGQMASDLQTLLPVGSNSDGEDDDSDDDADDDDF